MNGVIIEVLQYFLKAIEFVKPLYVILITIFSYLLFPDPAFISLAKALGSVIILDIIAKYYFLSVTNGGLINAIKNGKIDSDCLWRGTYKKLVGYLFVMILAGLSFYFTSVLQQVGIFFATVVYAILFIRECQSIIEKLVRAGHDLSWFLFWLRKKEDRILERENRISKREDRISEREDRISGKD